MDGIQTNLPMWSLASRRERPADLKQQNNMARPTASPNQNKTLFIFWLATVPLLFWFMNKNNSAAPKDVKALPEVFKQLQANNKETKDLTAVSTLRTYDSLVDDESKIKKITPEQANIKKLEGAFLVAQTQFRAGLDRNETQRIHQAFNLLWPFEKKMLNDPVWKTQKFTAAPDSRFPQVPQVATAEEMFEKISTTLTERNKSEKIWGQIPYGFQMIDALVNLTGKVPAFSYAFGAFLLAFVVRLIVFPFTKKTIMHSRQMSQLSPLLNEIKEKFKDDPQQMQLKTMELYKEYGLNPMAGCGPAFVQMPLFLTVYQCMLLYQFEFQKGTFLWINEAASKNTSGFIAPNLGSQDSILIVLYGISMIISQMLTPVNDPAQKKQMRLMGIGISVLFTFFMFTGAFPVVGGFVLYWTFTNILATIQSLMVYRLPIEPISKVTTKPGGIIPSDPTSMFPWMKGMNLPKSPNGAPTSKAKTEITAATKTGKPKQHKPKRK
jgi:YidC/Oxa1 family membrane protein insertase